MTEPESKSESKPESKTENDEEAFEPTSTEAAPNVGHGDN